MYPGAPYHCGKTAFLVQLVPAGHTDRGGFHHDASERARQKRQQEIIADNKISQRYEGSRTHPGIRQHWNREMVGGRDICGAPLHEDPHGRDDDNCTRRPVLCVEQEKLNTNSSTKEELVRVDDLMPQILWM